MTTSTLLFGLGLAFWVRSTTPEGARLLTWACVLLGFLSLYLESIAP